jgi:hypothetical protein
MFIILSSSVVKGMGQLVSSHSSKGTVLEVIGPFVAVEWRLEDTSWENDLAIRRRVVRIDGLGVHLP